MENNVIKIRIKKHEYKDEMIPLESEEYDSEDETFLEAPNPNDLESHIW